MNIPQEDDLLIEKDEIYQSHLNLRRIMDFQVDNTAI